MKTIRNCVEPQQAKIIFEAAFKKKQITLDEAHGTKWLKNQIGLILGIIGLASSATVVGVTTNVGNRVKRRRSRRRERNEISNSELEPKRSAQEVNEEIEQDYFEKWS